MAVIHKTTLNPGKLELLTGWLPAQPWYRDRGREPELDKAGGFRLDDPLGEVGIEFMVVTDGSDDRAAVYLVPLTYRASALTYADDALVGTTEHGVLGRRWVYDGTHDPVLVAQLVALIQGAAQPQAQSVSDTPDPTVTSRPAADGILTAGEFEVTGNGPSGTDLWVRTSAADGSGSGSGAGQLDIRVCRVLRPDGDALGGAAGRPCLSATWRLPDGTRVRGTLATAQYSQTPG